MANMQQDTKNSIVKRELGRILRKHGNVTARIVLDEARNPKHPLHRYFEWDDKKAAEEFRLKQAYEMILASRMTVIVGEAARTPPRVVSAQPIRHTVRQFVNTGRGCGFAPRAQALSDAVSRRALAEKKLRELEGWCESVVDIPELATLRTTIVTALARIARRTGTTA